MRLFGLKPCSGSFVTVFSLLCLCPVAIQAASAQDELKALSPTTDEVVAPVLSGGVRQTDVSGAGGGGSEKADSDLNEKNPKNSQRLFGGFFGRRMAMNGWWRNAARVSSIFHCALPVVLALLIAHQSLFRLTLRSLMLTKDLIAGAWFRRCLATKPEPGFARSSFRILSVNFHIAVRRVFRSGALSGRIRAEFFLDWGLLA